MIPTAITPAEAKYLSDLSRDKIVYEAGALFGASTIAMAQTAKFIVSVDPHDGYPSRAPSSTWEVFLENIRAAGVADRVQPVQAIFEQALPFANYGFAFADLTGQQDITTRFLAATGHIALVAVHDYERTGCHGVKQAVTEFIRYNPRQLSRVGSLIVLSK